MEQHDGISVIGAGVIGCAVACALSKVGRRVLLIDRGEPATAGASFGNVGHIATEQLEPLPSLDLLFNFWRELVPLGGVLDLPLRRIPRMAPWILRFARAAFQQKRNTEHLAPLVRCSADTLDARLSEIGRRDLLRRNGHYALWFGPKAAARADADRARAAMLGIATRPAPEDLLRATSTETAGLPAGVWYPDTAHVLDPALIARAFATAAIQAGASFLRTSIRHMQPIGERIELATDSGSLSVRTAVICTGAWSPPFLSSFGIHAPLEAERGYHIELPDHPPRVDAPIFYADRSLFVTPMASRLRASSYLEFAGLLAPADATKPARLRKHMRELGYRCDSDGAGWMGPRPTLPDYLPGIGRAPGPHELFYAVGHQHLGLTLAAVTGDLIAELVTGRPPRFELGAFDLRRFGRP